MRNQKFLTATELSQKVGIPSGTINHWYREGRLVGKDMGKNNIFTNAEGERLSAAIEAAGGNSKLTKVYLDRSLHMAKEPDCYTTTDVANASGCHYMTALHCVEEMGLAADRGHAAILDREEYDTAVQQCLNRKRARREPNVAQVASVAPVVKSKLVTVNIHGITVTMAKESAESIAEEILKQL